VLQTDTFKADVGCYNMLMDAYGRTRQWLEAENTFASMKRRQCVPTETSFNILMAAYSRGGQLERAEQLFNEMQEHNYFPGKADLLLNYADETGRLCFFGRRTIVFLAVNLYKEKQNLFAHSSPWIQMPSVSPMLCISSAFS
jgi:pentatricopeptide repeat protein